jgi:hypothetical protein
MPCVRVLLPGIVALLLAPAPARAEWSAAAYLGTAWTRAATLTYDRGPVGRIVFADVPFDSRSFESPPYYGYRVRWFPRASRIGAEAEVIHLKVYARPGRLGTDIRRFSMSHGLNLLLANAVLRARIPSARRVAAIARLGAGVAVPHGESDVGGRVQAQYEAGALALQATAGAELGVASRARAFAEYKVTTAAPRVSVAGGSIQARYLSQHLAAGLGVAW